jgi:hypothetical protein
MFEHLGCRTDKKQNIKEETEEKRKRGDLPP